MIQILVCKLIARMFQGLVLALPSDDRFSIKLIVKENESSLLLIMLLLGLTQMASVQEVIEQLGRIGN